MGRPKSTTAIDKMMLIKVEEDLRSIPQSSLSLKLQAIRAIGRGFTLKVVAEVNGVTQNTLFRWVRDYKQNGLRGLIDRPKGHRPKNLSPENERIIWDWVAQQVDPDGQPIHWTINQLRQTILERLNVPISYTRLWTWLHQNNFKLKVPRPRHIQSDPQKQEEFKKKSSQPDRSRNKARK